jgi:hypothetical protein
MTTEPAVDPSQLEDYELASARVEWVRISSCLDLPVQREALNWHLATCEAAFDALPGDTAGPTESRHDDGR